MAVRAIGIRTVVAETKTYRLLIVEDNISLSAALADGLTDDFESVVCAHTIADAQRQALQALPDVVLLDVNLPDGDAFALLDTLAGLKPFPLVVAMSGSAQPVDSFRLGKLGVRAYIEKPVELSAVKETFAQVLASAPSIAPHIKNLVGHTSLKDVEAQVRDTMVEEALARKHGSRRGAARLLGISRQLLQHIFKKKSAD